MKPVSLVCAFFCAVSLALAEDPAEPAVREVVYKTTPQGELKMFLHVPPGGQPGDKRPAIVFFFGGGWTSGKVTQFESQARYLAERGMVAARADYRVRSRHMTTPLDCVEDAKSAVRYLRSNAAKLGIDPERIVSAGGSAGGHIAACTALSVGYDATTEDQNVSSRPNALLLYNPVLDVSTLPKDLQARFSDQQATIDAVSPIKHLTKNTPPALLLFGSDDPLIAQGEAFVQKSREVGNRVEMFTAEGEKHGFFNRPPWTEKTTARAAEFLASLGYIAPPKE